MRRLALATAFALIALTAPAAAQTHRHSANMSHVKNLPYEARNGDDAELRHRHRVREAARQAVRARRLVPQRAPDRRHLTARAGARSRRVYDCGVTQGDVQVFRQRDERGRTFATYTSDTFGDGTSACYREARRSASTSSRTTAPARTARSSSTSPTRCTRRRCRSSTVPQGSHNQTVHPSGNYLYNSNSDLITSLQPGDRDLRHHATWPRRGRSASWRCPRAPGSAPSRTTSPSTPTARAPTRRRSRRA